MRFKVLVVASQTVGSSSLLSAMLELSERAPTKFTLLVPGGAGLPTGMVDAAIAGQRSAGIDVELVLGDPDPILAVRDVWAPSSFDEVLVSTLPDQSSRWLRSGLPFRIQYMTGALVRHVADPGDASRSTAGRAVDAAAVKTPAARSLRRRRMLPV
jgi:hypothetical protein